MSRRCAYEALLAWENGSYFAEDLLARHSNALELSPPDRALAQEILYGVLRNLLILDLLIDELRSKGKLKLTAQCLVRIGLYQLLFTEIAEHAAINESVSLAKKHERGVVNAILRTAQRRKDELLQLVESAPLDERTSHPEFLVERWTEAFGQAATEQLCELNNQPPKVYGRVNGCHPDPRAVQEFIASLPPTSFQPEPFADFFELPSPFPKDAISQGLIYVQDPATLLSCRLLDPQPGECILDACAAPGGKTALLAQLLPSPDAATIIAADSVPDRIERLQQNLHRMRLAEQVACIQHDLLSGELPPGSEEGFDAILIDAPCSNTGVIRRRVDVRWRLQEWDFAQQAKKQLALIESAVKLLKPDGRIIYSTCSIDPEENEELIKRSGLTVEETVHSRPWETGYDGAFAARLTVGE